MGYVGRTPAYGYFERQVESGDGSTTQFNLDYPVASPNQLLVSVDGIIQEPDYSYSTTVSSGQGKINFSEAPDSSSRIFIIYTGRQLLTATPNTASSYIDEFNGDGSTTAFTLTRTPSSTDGSNFIVYIDNVYQREGSSYAFTVSGSTITFTSAPASGTNNIQVYQLATANAVATVSDGAVTTAKLANGAVTSAKLDTNVTSRLDNLEDRASTYVWSQWNPSSSGVQTNAPSTADSSYTSPYISQSNSSGTLTITFNTAGRYMVFYSMQLNQSAAITFSYCRGTLGGTATRYLTQTDILQTNGAENEENLTVHFLVSATAGQTVTMLPSGRCDHSTSASYLTFNANISTLFLGDY